MRLSARTLNTYGAIWAQFFIFGIQCATAQPSQHAAMEALKTGGHVLIMRHAQTVSGIGDPENFKLDDCSTQRNLSESGRDHARQIGAKLRAANVRFDSVYSSAWCRCVDTAALMFNAKPHLMPALYSTFNDRSQQPGRTDELRQFIRSVKTKNNVALVTHQVVISSLTNEFTNMGDVLVLKPDAKDAAGFKLIGKL